MLSTINAMSDLTILLGSLWILLTSRIPTRTGSSIVLTIIGMSSLGNLVTTHEFTSPTEICLKLGVAMFVAYAWWKIEAKHLFCKRVW